MKKQLFTALMACSVLGLVGTASAAPPADKATKGGAYGYWAGKLCDHVGPTTNGMTYWESRNYADRGTCVELEGESLERGEWNPADWPL